MTRTAIVSAVRTPFGKAGRAYAAVHPTDLLATAYRGALEAVDFDPGRVGEVISGCTHQGGDQTFNVARNGWLAGGFPVHVPATTIDTQCGSSQQAVNFAAGIIASGQADVVMAGGIESLSRVPMLSVVDVNNGSPHGPSITSRFDMPGTGTAGERMARKYGVTREQSDAWGLRSHLAAADAWREGVFKDEVFCHEVDGVAVLEHDEGVRSDSTADVLATLRPCYEETGVITAASASQLSDGASALLLASEDACERYDLQPMAWINHAVTVGADPELMLEGPIHATSALLERSGLSLDVFDLFEVHEAFASVICAWLSVHDVDDEKVNRWGGAISMGHPFGASGGRQLARLAHALKTGQGSLAMQVMCCGGGIGTGTILAAP